MYMNMSMSKSRTSDTVTMETEYLHFNFLKRIQNSESTANAKEKGDIHFYKSWYLVQQSKTTPSHKTLLTIFVCCFLLFVSVCLLWNIKDIVYLTQFLQKEITTITFKSLQQIV